MNISYREQLAHFISTNQSAVTGGMLFVVAFSVFAMNATFNQSGNHPLPLWNPPQNIVTNSVSVPVRRVETTRFSATKIPVPRPRPLPRPLSTPIQHTQPQFTQLNQPGEFVSNLPVDGTKIQHILSKLGFYSGPLDGMIGSQTTIAIREFERSKFLPESGTASPALLLLLESTIQARLKNQRLLSNDNTSPQTGNKNEAAIVTRIQVGLINYGISGVSIDGLMGNQTSQAIREFQRKFNMNVDGRASDELVKKLVSVGALTKD